MGQRQRRTFVIGGVFGYLHRCLFRNNWSASSARMSPSSRNFSKRGGLYHLTGGQPYLFNTCFADPINGRCIARTPNSCPDECTYAHGTEFACRVKDHVFPGTVAIFLDIFVDTVLLPVQDGVFCRMVYAGCHDLPLEAQ